MINATQVKVVFHQKLTSFKQIAYKIIWVTLIGVVVGAISATGATLFAMAVSYLNDLLFISPKSRIFLNNQPLLKSAVTIMIPTIGGLIVGWLIYKYSSLKRPLGPPDVIYSTQSRTTVFLNTKNAIVSTIASVISIGFGASVGQYGPMVVMGGVIGGWVNRLKIRIPNLITIGVGCGVAAAISAAFNAPISGILFAHEAVIRHYSLQSFAPVTVAAAVGYIVSNVVFKTPAIFEVSFSGVEYGHEFIIFMLIGLLSAILAVWFMKLLMFVTRMSAKWTIQPWLKPSVAGFVLGVVAIQIPEVLGVGKEALRFATIEGAYLQSELVIIIISKIVLTALCIGLGFAGGIFSPALLVGILWGALLGGMVDDLGIANSGVVVYAICGMISLASSVIGAPLTMIMIVFELTRSYDITIAAMVSVVFANLLAMKLFDRSLFDMQLKNRGMDLSHGRDQAILELEKLLPYVDVNVVSLSSELTVEEAKKIMLASLWQEAVVIDEQQRYLGNVTLSEIINADAQQNIQEIAHKSDIVFYEATSVWSAMVSIKEFVGEAVPVLDNKDNSKVIGQITEGQVLSAYFDSIQHMRDEEHAGI